MSDFDPFSLPMSPSWVGDAGSERFTVSNSEVRDATSIPRSARVLEISCGKSLIATVHPRGGRQNWRLHLIDRDEHLLPADDPPIDLSLYRDVGEEPAADAGRQAPFKCVCGRFHVLDRDAVLEAAARLEPKRGKPAKRIDLREVARVVRRQVT